MTILAIIILAVGALIAIGNWYSILASRRLKRFVSPLPLLGGILLVIGLLILPSTRPFAWLGLIADWSTLSFILVIPRLVKEAWQTSNINLIHKFESHKSACQCDIRLYKRGVLIIRCRYNPPALSNEYGALCSEADFVGNWSEEEYGFRLEGYSGERILEIRLSDGKHITKELNYPADEQYPYDKLDALVFEKIR